LTTHRINPLTENLMSSSSNQSPRRTDHPRLRAVQNALLWLGLIVLAVVPIPFW
jgi:hypothetical protein